MSSQDTRRVANSDTSTSPTSARSSSGTVAPDVSSRRAIFFVASKGGVGKSVASRGLIDLIRMSTTRKISAWDLDGGTGSLALYYDEDPIRGVGLNNVSDPSETDWLEAMYDESVDDVILDVPGGKTDALYQTFSGGPTDLVKFIDRANRKTILVTVIGTDKDSVATVLHSIETFGTSVTHVILKNGFWGTEDSFVIFDGIKTDSGQFRFGNIRKAAEAINASIIYLPRVDARTYALLNYDDITFAQARNEAATIGRKAAFQAETWLELVAKAFSKTPIDPAGLDVRA